MQHASHVDIVRRVNWTRHACALLAYAVPTFFLGYVWHLLAFDDYYKSLNVYRTDILIPFGVLSIFVQAGIWTFIYARLFSGMSVIRGALGFAALAAPLAWSFHVIAVAAKHHMASVTGYVAIETAFVLVQYAVVSPLIAVAYAARSLSVPRGGSSTRQLA